MESPNYTECSIPGDVDLKLVQVSDSKSSLPPCQSNTENGSDSSKTHSAYSRRVRLRRL
jgi:hypothetical protein